MVRLLLALLCLAVPAPLLADTTPRTAIVSAFEPEWEALKASVTDAHEETIAGTRFVTGAIAGRPVLLFLSGESMVNAAMTTQKAIDRFHVARILFSGIAGGIDPALDVGDVVVPDRWAEYLEATFARKSGDGFAPPDNDFHGDPALGHYGMIYPRAAQVTRDGTTIERREWFAADPALLAVARKAAASVTLARCAAGRCLRAQPRLVVGGNGLSGSVFMDNAEFRAFAFASFHAQVLDMETAAVAHVAYANGVPFLGVRSLSDLAGGDPAANQAFTFFRLASENSAAVVKALVAALPLSAPAP